MIVIIEQDLFRQKDVRSLALMELLALGWGDRHAIITNPMFKKSAADPINTWLRLLDTRTSSEIEAILEQGPLVAHSLPAQTARIHVGQRGTDWTKAIISLEDTIRLLRTPLKLLFENRRNDYKFLLRLAPPTQRLDLERAIQKGWIELEQAGGLGELKTILLELATAPEHDTTAHIHRLRLWVMFDRDSAPSDRAKPSPDSEEVRAICESPQLKTPWPLRYFQLGRRSIESYIPEKILRVWESEAHGREMVERRKKVDALSELSKVRPNARWQYNMKSGLIGDVPGKVAEEIKEQRRQIRDDDLDPLYKGLDHKVREALTKGFGKDISALYSRAEPSWEASFQNEYSGGPKGQPSRSDLLDSLFSRM